MKQTNKERESWKKKNNNGEASKKNAVNFGDKQRLHRQLPKYSYNIFDLSGTQSISLHK